MTSQTFVDRKQRSLTVIEEDLAIRVHDGEREVAHLRVASRRGPLVRGKSSLQFGLLQVEVEPDYRRAGIGMELLYLAKEWFDPLFIPEATESEYPAYEALLEAARRRGLLLETWPLEVDEAVRAGKRRDALR